MGTGRENGGSVRLTGERVTVKDGRDTVAWRRSWLSILGAGVVLLCQAVSPAAAQSRLEGVVVEAVMPGSAGDRAGVRPGDLLSAWTREPSPPANPTGAGGRLRSPFDLNGLEIEQAPRGTVVLSGRRRGGMRVTLTLPSGRWGITARPSLAANALATYRRGRTLLDSEKAEAAAAEWKRGAAATADGTIAAWLWLQVSNALADGDQLAEAHAALASGLASAQRAGDRSAIAGLQEAEGLLFERQRDAAGAERAYRAVIATRQGSGVANLGTAKGFSDLAFVAIGQGDFVRGEQHMREAVALQETLAPRSFMLARSLANLAHFADARGDLDTAAPLVQRAVDLLEAMVPGTRDHAGALTNLGSVVWRRGELDAARTLHERALAIYQRLDPDGVDVASALNNLAVVATDRGRLGEAEQLLRRVLVIFAERAPDSREHASALNNLASVLTDRGDLAAAEDLYVRALEIRERAFPDSLDLADTLNNLGEVASARGDFTRAGDYFTRALAAHERIAPESLNAAATLNNLGANASERGDFDRAETFYRRALAIKERVAPGSVEVATGLVNLGDLARDRGDLAGARARFEQARQLLETVSPGGVDLATVVGDLADLADLTGERPQAEQLATRALALVEAVAPDSDAHASALRRLGRLAVRAGQPARAVSFFARAITALEAQVARVGGSAEARSGFVGQAHGFYVDYIDALMADGQAVAAFDALERSRARGLLMMLGERDLVLDAELPSELRQAARDLDVQYDQAQAALADLHPATDAAEIDRLQLRLRDLRESRSRLVDRLRATSPRLSAVRYPQPLTLPGVQQALDAGTVMLSYEVGTNESRVFVAGRPADGAPASFQAHTIAIGEAALRADVTALRRQIERQAEPGAVPSQAYLEVAQRLYDRLVAPAEATLANAQRVLIVADGPLHSLPFDALVRPASASPDRPWQYLVEWKPIHTTLSATVYDELRKAPRPAASTATLVAFGDPQYATAGEVATTPAWRSLLRGGDTLQALPATRTEVDALARIFRGSATTYVGADATEARVKTIGQARYVHFATHGLIDPRSPLNSALALAAPGDRRAGQENGLLQAWEIFEQFRLDADMVTLSACETALGAELAGEGLIGLTRAFHYAGARSVLASLWRVADDSTTRLMTRVYEHLKAGLTKDEALQRAQRELIAQPDTSAPFHWAAFSLSGDWR